MIQIDGSLGEGGGQVLRSSLALSILTEQTVQIDNIRSGRAQPGLMPQHLKAVQAAAAVSRAQVEGATLHSTSLVFRPGKIRSGRYSFDIGTAGATTLVLQTIFLPLNRATSASTVTITGGTHVPWSPCFHYLDLQWLPAMRQIGFEAQCSLDLAGFYPPGGGRITATIRPAGRLSPLVLEQRGELQRISGLSAVANLDRSIADRQKRQAMLRLQSIHPNPKIKTLELPSPSKGTFLLLLAEFETGRCCYYDLGERGKPAERVADEAVDALLGFLATDGAIDPYLADQLLLPLAFASDVSVLRTSRITLHLLTNAEILRQFLPIRIDIHGREGEPGSIGIYPSGR